MIINTNTGGNNLQKYNMFVAQIGCAAFGVLALSLFGPGWFARGAALSASIAFMTITGASHPPGKSPKTNISSGYVAPAVCLHLFTELLFCWLLIISEFLQLQACPSCLLMARSFTICNFGTCFSLELQAASSFA
jgi:hypothetical protein